jgi:hypothetical protein
MMINDVRKRLGEAGVYFRDDKTLAAFNDYLPLGDEEKCLGYILDRLSKSNANNPGGLLATQYRGWIEQFSLYNQKADTEKRPWDGHGVPGANDTIFTECNRCGSFYQRLRRNGCPYCEEHPKIVQSLVFRTCAPCKRSRAFCPECAKALQEQAKAAAPALPKPEPKPEPMKVEYVENEMMF